MLVEDSDDDVMLFQLALRRTGLGESFNVVWRFQNGEQSLDYFLNRSRSLQPEPLPDILILDLKLPGCSGLDVLDRLQTLKPRPVTAMFSTSILPEDKERATALGVDIFQTKTFELSEFSRFLNWLAHLADFRARG